MASQIKKVVDSYIDIPFNAYLTIILFLTYQCTLHSKPLLLLLVFITSAAILIYDTTSTIGGLIKIMCELPLGLGSVLAFQVTNPSFQARYLSAFTTYVNVAVYGNIGMMVATPTGGTLRGKFARGACAALFVWIVQQGYRAQWRTVALNHRFFVFTAVSKSWIFAHAVYRAVLLTLPCFTRGPRYRLLEGYSLGLTLALAVAEGVPFEWCFGQADTLVVPVISALSAVVSMFGLLQRERDVGANANKFGARADVGMSVLLVGVIVFACYSIATLPDGQSTRGAIGKRE
ncbi:hypothetical protein DM02DRAFT_592254 [Periconia macrospinosa]|uniref:Uncharacterized protein n=1 Tax=Periconia macrospinosa TaxID=97972 RepID=A0A2V1DRQ1_9PLEO|nr:hypothetical protein DM02DRAFT_592254 [Periconia macrospinosa]